MAGIITYIAPVEKASGKIFGKKSRFVAVTRKNGNRKNGCAVMGQRTTPVTPEEVARREKFAACCAATRGRMESPTQAPIDKAAYAQVKGQYNSLWHYVFRQECESYGS